ncbi:F-box/LRR-repeat protein 17-like [Salvia splendens]|uniref:F-box/LRR-repeat protein 17-like n=1 Tax=Salvia splendens TaxID=180675 RepID=UPI001C264988|nr:F-box/LRR-repeat protein 17-like [Salvia splendens]
MQGHQPHPATPISDAAFLIKRGKKRGSYNCGRCGLPKKGHNCPFAAESDDASTPAADDVKFAAELVDDLEEEEEEDGEDREEIDECPDLDLDGSGGLPASCLWEVLRRLPPVGMLSAARVCRGWRETTKRLWRAAEELRLRVPAKAQIGFVGSVLQKCPGLLKLSVAIESDVDATMLACIAFSCPNLQSLEISTSDSCINRISGDDLARFISDKKCLTSLKMEGCSNLGGFVFSSTSLSSLWLSDLHSLPKMVFNCPSLKEISLEFSRLESDTTDLTSVMDGLGRSCPKLQNIHIASVLLSHDAILALSSANLRGLRMLSLVLGLGITDASVAAIASSFTKLELLDLSGSSISDSGLGMICNVFPETLSKLLLALCPNITSSGIQFAAAQLPCLELMDCGMTICDLDCEKSSDEEDDGTELQKTPNSKMHLTYQKLIIKHNRLKKLSLWGCSGLDALYLNCPNLYELNLNSCRNLHPERLLLQCTNLNSVYAMDCENMLIKTIETQVDSDYSPVENQYSSKRLPDGSKRVRVPYICSPQPCNDGEKGRRPTKRHCAVIAYGESV